MNKDNFYITTTLPYVNAAPHIGFALEITQADAIARYRKDVLGQEVVFNTGTDEHGLKIYNKAKEEGVDVGEYVDGHAKKFRELANILNISITDFIRTTDPHHVEAAKEFWRRCDKNGDIYKKPYKIKYCIGCELEKTESELTDNRCPVHPNMELEIIEEENYFFRFSKYTDPLKNLYKENPDFVVPDFRFNEIKKFVESGLEDFSISRLKEKMPWGVPVPGDNDHVMYVWFDALVNYISTLGWPEDEDKFNKFWPGVQVAGKDNLRQQSAMWQAMLMSAELAPSKQIMIHGFITSGGEKMSKSLGNVVDPVLLANEYGTEALRYWLLREMNTFEDGDFTLERFKEAYTAHLSNGIGNLASRIMKLAEDNLDGPVDISNIYDDLEFEKERYKVSYPKFFDKFEIGKVADLVWEHIAKLDSYINESEPFKIIKTDPEEGRKVIKKTVLHLWQIAHYVYPFLPETSNKIKKAIIDNKKPEALFPRLR